VGSKTETLALPSIRPQYRPRGLDPLRKLFRQRFPAFEAAYEQRYAAFFGKFRLPLISRAASAFRLCGDWSQGIARIRCPDCGYDLFRPFSCKSFFLCASCAQKRTLLLGEYLSGDLLLCLPHRQFVWTIPKVLRVFLRHDRQLFADIGRLLYDILTRYFTLAAGRNIRTAMVSSHQTFGEFAAWHPHWHAIVLEGGFDNHDRFFFIPLGANEALSEIWRRRVIALFLSKGLLNPDFARKLLSWRHSGFSIESGTRIYDQEARQALSQYIVRPPLSLEKIHWDEEQDTVTWKSCASGYFRGREKHFSALGFIAQLTLHIPPLGRQPVAQQTAGGPGPPPGASIWIVFFAGTGHLERPPPPSALERLCTGMADRPLSRPCLRGPRRIRPRAGRCTATSAQPPAGKPGHGCLPRCTNWTSWPVPNAEAGWK